MGNALILVDAQRDMLEGETAVEQAETFRAALFELLERARAAGVPIVHVQNDGAVGEPDQPWTPGWELSFRALPGEPVVRKAVGNTFEANPALADVLRAMGVDAVVVAGLQSERCIQATSRGALAHGFDVTVPSDGHTTYDDGEPAAAIAERVTRELEADGVRILDLEHVVFAR
ncbi:isochorismatase family protein [Kitasatospora herbaricolor]|uniref:isochorismatase family protein n=1 Tax=Kitasatospora herbaricolor TaxID=68217 RepID=UPI0036DC62E2